MSKLICHLGADRNEIHPGDVFCVVVDQRGRRYVVSLFAVVVHVPSFRRSKQPSNDADVLNVYWGKMTRKTADGFDIGNFFFGIRRSVLRQNIPRRFE